MTPSWKSVQVATCGLIAFMAVACTLDAQGDATGSFDRTLQVAGPVELSVRTGSGRIEIQPGDDGSVHVVGRIRARGTAWGGLTPEEQIRRLEATPPVEQSGNTIRVGEIHESGLRQNVSISYELRVPAATRVTSRSGSGSQTIGDIGGPVEASAGSGSIRVARVGGAATLATGSGQIELESCEGVLDAVAGSGSIVARAVAGPIRARTGSGHIEVRQTAPGEVDVFTGSGGISIAGVSGPMRLRTGSGSITVDGDPQYDWTARTGSGGIDLHLPANASFDLDAETGSGGIDTARAVRVLGSTSRRRLQATVGAGGARVALSTSSGHIRIE